MRSTRFKPSRRTSRLALLAMFGSLIGVVVIAAFAFTLAIGGSDFGCTDDGGGSAGGPAPSRSAVRDIPPDRLRLYRSAGRRIDIDWTFLASIGAQECDHRMCRG